MRPVCVECRVKMRPSKNNRGWLTYMTFQDSLINPSITSRRPYELWATDEYECPTCKKKILTGFGANPISEHFHSDFDDWVRTWRDRDGVIEEAE